MTLADDVASGPPPVVDPIAEVERALTRARLLADGGPYVHVRATQARRQARSAGRQNGQLPLSGFTVAVKEMIAVAGVPQGAGSATMQGATPSGRDAHVVAELGRLGATVIGTTTMHELAFGVTGANSFAGTPEHPHGPSRLPGGSSSGSAVAVADGSARLGLGTDTGGSVRIPAALCGVVGFKPARGELPMDGVLPLSETLDHVGLLARSVDDIVAVRRAMGGSIGVDRPRRLGVVRAELESADPAVAESMELALRRFRRAGITIAEIDWPEAARISEVSTTIMFAEAAATHAETLARDGASLQASVRERLERGARILAVDYLAAMHARERMIAEVGNLLGGVDAVVGPTVPVVAPPKDRADDPGLPPRLVANTRLANVVGLPALSIPLPGDGLPVGLHVLASSSARLLGVSLGLTRHLTA